MAFCPVLPKNDILRLTLTSGVFLLVLGICYHKSNIVKYSEVANIIKNKVSHI
jgi:hypothetical protein